MYNPDTEVLFPPRILAILCDMRGPVWRDLVNRVRAAGPDSLDQMAFILMMARINNCATCNSDSYRAMNGCMFCTRQSLKRFHEKDEVLAEIFLTNIEEVEQYLQSKATRYQRDTLDHLQTING